MDQLDDFISGATKAAQGVVADLLSLGAHQVRQGFLSQASASRCRARLAYLLAFVRQLIFLIAAALMNEPPPEEAPQSGPDGKGPRRPAPDRPHTWRFTVAPSPSSPPSGFPDLPPHPQPEEVKAQPFIGKAAILSCILANPLPYAQRLVLSLRRWKAAGEIQPVCRPVVPRFRGDRPAEIFGPALTAHLNRALAAIWHESG
jgi:hypothetical protein